VERGDGGAVTSDVVADRSNRLRSREIADERYDQVATVEVLQIPELLLRREIAQLSPGGVCLRHEVPVRRAVAAERLRERGAGRVVDRGPVEIERPVRTADTVNVAGGERNGARLRQLPHDRVEIGREGRLV